MTYPGITQAMAVLHAPPHRGARTWQYDPQFRWVIPEERRGMEDATLLGLTAFEARAVARHLAIPRPAPL